MLEVSCKEANRVEENLMTEPIELFSITGHKATGAAREAIQALGLSVVEKVCPASTADWVEFPFVRDPSGSAYYGEEGVKAFVARARKQLAVS